MRAIDPIQHIRAHPEMYLPGGTVDPQALVRLLVRDARLLGAAGARGMRASDWWLVLASHDWLGDSRDDERSLFSNIVPFPQVGPNSMRSEVLLTAFADDVVTFTPDRADVLKGDAGVAGDGPLDGESVPWFELPLWFGPLQPRRVIAFRARGATPARRAALAASVSR